MIFPDFQANRIGNTLTYSVPGLNPILFSFRWMRHSLPGKMQLVVFMLSVMIRIDFVCLHAFHLHKCKHFSNVFIFFLNMPLNVTESEWEMFTNVQRSLSHWHLWHPLGYECLLLFKVVLVTAAGWVFWLYQRELGQRVAQKNVIRTVLKRAVCQRGRWGRAVGWWEICLDTCYTCQAAFYGLTPFPDRHAEKQWVAAVSNLVWSWCKLYRSQFSILFPACKITWYGKPDFRDSLLMESWGTC